VRRYEIGQSQPFKSCLLQPGFAGIREPLAFWSCWLPISEEKATNNGYFEAGLSLKAGSFYLETDRKSRDLQRIRHNRKIAICPVPGRVKLVMALSTGRSEV
jgi:hypothetical protein